VKRHPVAYLFRADLSAVIVDICNRDFLDLSEAQRAQYGISDNENTCDLREAQQ
jgi:hypothetical protein